jgi:ABC-type uncharacterized transport system permease subunit
LRWFQAYIHINRADSILGYSLAQMIWYFAAVSFTWYFIYNSADTNISGKVLSGALISDLQKPLSLFQNELANAMAIRLLSVVFNFIPAYLYTAYSVSLIFCHGCLYLSSL